MIHVCHILTTFQTRSGMGKRTLAILKACVSQGFRTSLVVGEDCDGSRIDGVEIIVIPGLRKHLSLHKDIQSFKALSAVLNKLKPDVVHTHQAKAGVLGRVVASRMSKRPRILHTVHGPTFPGHLPTIRRMAYRWLECFAAKYTDQFVFVGEELRQEYVDGGVCTNDNSIVIRTGKPDELINRVSLSPRERGQLRDQLCGGVSPTCLISYVARIVPMKRHEHAISVLKNLRDQGVDAHLALVGKALVNKERDYESRLKALVEQQGLGDYVHFSGFYDNVYDVIEASDLLLLTSGYEGLPNIAVEAILLGVPLLAYEVSGLRELFRGQSTQFIVPQGDINGMTEKALEVLRGQRSQQSHVYDAGNVGELMRTYQLDTMLSSKIGLYQGFLN